MAKPNLGEEKKLWDKGYTLVIGVDEVGRGAFAGPVVAGAVAFPVCHPERSEGSIRLAQDKSRDSSAVPQNDNITIDDSKRLKPNARKKAAKWIKENCLAYGIGEVGVGTINKIGIGKATERAMRRAIVKLLDCYIAKSGNNLTMKQFNNCFVLVDAFHIKYLKGVGLKQQKPIKKGDQKSISIAAASIIAKVFRDSLMQRLVKRYSRYGWGRNKGYGTKTHREAIIKYGITRLHRKQFVQTFLSHAS